MRATEPAPRRLARQFGLYLLLIGGSAIFLWPLLWMVATSLKLNRESFGSEIRFWPEAPRPVLRSPYLAVSPNASDPEKHALLPVIRSQLAAMDLRLPATLDRDHVLDALAGAILDQLSRQFPETAWHQPRAELEREIERRVTSDFAHQVLAGITREVRLGPLVARSNDLQESVLTPAGAVPGSWKIHGPGRLLTAPEGAVLAYDFATAPEVRLTGRFKLPFPATQLEQLKLSIGNDDTYHTLILRLEKGGALYEAVRSHALADTTSQILLFRDPELPGFTAAEGIPWREIDRGPQYEADPRAIRITLQLDRSTLAGAWWQKIRRNYTAVFDRVPFWRYAATSLLLVLLNIIGTLFSCSLAAYSFARRQWPGRTVCFLLMLATMMAPAQVLMIPQFLIMKALGWYNTLLPLWVPSFFAAAFGAFLLTQFMRGIPRELEDAALIDGCGFWGSYWHIILPLSRPILAVIALFTFVGCWNDFIGPLIYLNDQRLYPLSLGLYALHVNAGGPNNLSMMMAASFLVTLPVILAFFFGQRLLFDTATSGMKS